MAPIVEMKGITKKFPGVVANDGISLSLDRGRIHTLLGENGAGKTTLMNILFGLIHPDAGQIAVDGRMVLISSPLDAIELGIGMVHQHFMLVPTMTVVENVLLGKEVTRGPFLNLKDAERRVKGLCDDFGLDVPFGRRISDLSVGEQQRVEILKTLYRDIDVLILDEPTAVLTPSEIEALFRILRSMKERGKTVVFISHKLKEVLALSDDVTVLRRGRVVGSVEADGATERGLARLMVGREIAPRSSKDVDRVANKRVVVELKDVELGEEGNHVALHKINLRVHAGEILGVAGVDGNGQTQLAETLAGLQMPDEGKVTVEGEDLTGQGAAYYAAHGIRYVPADRTGRGSVPSMPIAVNFALKCHRWRPYSRFGVINHRAIDMLATKLAKEFDVRCTSTESLANTLSGGNLQKLVLARETFDNPKLLIVEQPTRGLDIGATEYVHGLLLDESACGTAVVMISADLEEILGLSDRVIVMYEGAITYVTGRASMDVEEIGMAMAGVVTAA